MQKRPASKQGRNIQLACYALAYARAFATHYLPANLAPSSVTGIKVNKLRMTNQVG